MPYAHNVWLYMALALGGLRNKIGKVLGVAAERKEELYLDLSRGATLSDLVYWLQILFSAGIATLGLVLNSPAVIIGAMLISPLMGPILAAGLSLASGDLVLGVRSSAKIGLSCVIAVGFSLILVVSLPFQEMTGEIAARTEPNILDLIIALFSGAVGSVAVCRDVKGVATSIPGVAIAVALMPPLCVVGYGLGIMLTFDTSAGWRISSGGGLLFLTNLVAITFTAMIVFLAVKLSTAGVRTRAEEWGHNDPESAFVMRMIERFPSIAQAREVRSLPVRFALILIPLIAIFIPLGQAFGKLRAELSRQRQENVIRQEVQTLWQESFQTRSDGAARSKLDNVSISEKDGQLKVSMRLFDDDPYSVTEKARFVQLLASRLGRAPGTINFDLTEIPTSSVITSIRELEKEPEPPSISDLQSSLATRVDAAISSVEMPSDATIVNREMVLGETGKLKLNLLYLCSQTLDAPSEQGVIDRIKTNLTDAQAEVELQPLHAEVGTIDFQRGSSALPVLGVLQLDYVGRVMKENSALRISIALRRGRREAEGLQEQRFRALLDYLSRRWNVIPERVVQVAPIEEGDQPELTALIRFHLGEVTPEAVSPPEEPKE